MLDEYRVGQVVISKRGKDAGRAYVIIGFLGRKLALADALRFNVGRPKYKNPKHVTPTPRVIGEAAAWVEAERKIDRGELCRFLESACGLERRGGGANGK
ncbi:MAG: KOW domain-containing RNA-binding protein [Synergistaceae bacterium]|jgi:ribosomal protein L14E/L6E/L27E|nr:KOW domain-containing RNA-binding protein [Synergistaceae bacterium]